jgi:hypothetical protein
MEYGKWKNLTGTQTCSIYPLPFSIQAGLFQRPGSPVSWLSTFGARLIRATFLLDRAYLLMDRARAIVVTAFASDRVLAAYNDLTYAAAPVYDADMAQFREKLFNWEAGLIVRVFPKPPGRVLVGGAGGGREALQLAGMGYEVTAFEPAATLARSMRDRAARNGAAVEALIGRYEDMPILRRIEDGESCDLAQRRRFDAAMLGWSSFSHIRDGRVRSAVLRAFADITDGPVVVSFFLRRSTRHPRPPIKQFLSTLGRRSEGDAFTGHIGYYHLSSQDELAAEVEAAGLKIVDSSYDESDGHWPWIAVARPQIAERLATATPSAE